MKKLSFLRISQLVVFVGLIFASQISMAKMTSLTDEELGEVTAQAGIAINVDNLDLDTNIETLYYHDKDGLGEGTGTKGGYISLNDISIVGSVTFDKPMSVNVETAMDDAGNTEVTKVNMSMSDMTLDIDRFTVDSITLGSEAGEGKSLGSIGILGLHARMTGNVSISAY
jgi:hypothetical protein